MTRAKWMLPLCLLMCSPAVAVAQDYDGLSGSLNNLYRLSNAKSYSISPENLTGEKGKGAMAIQGTASRAARDLEIGRAHV